MSLEISKLPNISPEIRAAVIEEFLHTTDFSALGIQASSFASQVVERGLSSGVSAETAQMVSRQKPLNFLRRVDPHQLLSIVRKEHPQTIALVLSHLQAQQASAVLQELPPSLQTEVARRLAEIENVSSDILQDVEKILENRLFSLVEGEYPQADGKDALVEILSQSDRSTEEKIISGLTSRSPNLANDIKTKLCEFEDLMRIDEGSLQQVLRLTDIRDLVLALKGATKELASRIYGCMAPDAARALREDVETMGVVDWKEIKAAQQQIRNILRGLVTLGKIKFR